jgi:hypothetical protein
MIIIRIPIRSCMAGLTTCRKSGGIVIRVVRSTVVRSVTAQTNGRRSLKLSVGVTLLAVGRDMRSG